MNKLLYAYIARLRKNVVFLFGLTALLIYGIVLPFSLHSDNIRYAHDASPDKAFGAYVIPVCLLTAFVCCVFCGEEYEYGTVQNKIIVGHNRNSIYSAQFISCWIAGITMSMAFLIPSTILDLILLGSFKNSFGVLFMYFISGLLCVSVCTSLYCMLITAMQKRISGTVLTLFIMLVIIYMGIIVGQTLMLPPETAQFPVIDGTVTRIFGENPRYPKGAYRVFLEYFYDFLPSGQAWKFNTMTAENLPRMAVSSCIILLLSFLSGIRIFEKKDLK
ncbi:MAG: ABC transporter permease [Oscillospiraceae bacterium]|nr:ABC transporter permease [Oscillospiraceae bacterium]